MDGRKIFDAINTCDDVFIEKVVLDMENRRKKQERLRRLFFDKNQHLSGIRIAAAIVLFIVILGVGVKTTAHVSMLFRDWMENVFQKSDVTEIVPDSKTADMGDSKISFRRKSYGIRYKCIFHKKKMRCYLQMKKKSIW